MTRAPLIAVPFVCACSLVLDEVPVATCSNDSECAVLDALRGAPATCRKHFCSANGRCVEHADGAEVCDGSDNDCDGKIDETGTDGTTLVVSGTVAAEDVADVVHLAYGDAASRSVVAWTVEGDNAFAAPLGVPGSMTAPVTLATSAADSFMDNRAISGRCYRETATGVASFQCNATEMVLVPVGERRLGAVVNTTGCAGGLLYAGQIEAGSNELMIRGPLRRSNSFIGVDPTSTGTCTGASRASCGADGSGPGCGAARPALATIDHGAPRCGAGVELCPDRVGEGLLAFLGAGVSRGRCGGSDVGVEALGLHLMIAPFGGPVLWVTASNEGVPETLGTTSGGGRPSVVAWEDRGYVVAYGASGGGVSLHFVPPLPEPPTYDGISGAVDDRTGQELGPIPGIVDLGSIGAPGGAPDHVALAIGAHEGGELALGIAWLSGCGEGGEGIVFRRVALTVAGDAPTGIAGTRDAARLGEAPDGEILGSPAVIYQRSGFVVEGFERGGAVAGASRTGGFVVAWATGLDTDGDGRPDARGRMLATRVAALDGAPVDAAERIDLTQGDAANAWEPHLFGADGFAYWNRAAGTIVAGELACPPR